MSSKMKCEIRDEWDELLASFPDDKQDIYFKKKYLSLYETEKNKALCAVCIDDDNVMLMPFIRGEINDYYDFETAYGYGGPVANIDDEIWCHDAFDKIHAFLGENNYVCGFTRSHPLFSNERLLKESDGVGDNTGSVQLLYDRQTVAIDTSQNLEDIWQNQISSKNRNMIRKAEKNQLEYRAEYDFASYEEFIAIYKKTMERLEADDFYYFDDSYFEKMRNNLSDCSFLGTVRKDGKLICAAIFMYSKKYGHYHLEGSDWNYSSLGANNYLLWKTACEMHNLGIKEFHLGGGTSSAQDDSLFKFKKAFSKNLKSFYIGKEIFNVPVYEEICNNWEQNNAEKIPAYGNRLLKYRY